MAFKPSHSEEFFVDLVFEGGFFEGFEEASGVPIILMLVLSPRIFPLRFVIVVDPEVEEFVSDVVAYFGS